MKLDLPTFDRRTLLVGGGIGVGLVVAFAAWPRRDVSPLRASGSERAFGPFIKIAPSGRVTVAVPQVETGQGVWTALPQIVADELGAAWEMVAVEPAPAAPVYANPLAEQLGWLEGVGRLHARRLRSLGAMRLTAGSTSIRAFEAPLREAGAVARTMLVEAAASRWAVEPDSCDAVDGFVIHQGKRLGFGELAEQAAALDPPGDPELRNVGALIGRDLPRLDLPSKIDGSFRFAADVRLPDMLFASARMAPPGGRLAGFDRAAAEAVPGVREVVAGDAWVAALGETMWAAEQGMRRADVRFAGPVMPDNRGLKGQFEAAIDSGEFESWMSRGDFRSAVLGSRPLSATYWVGPATHGGLEPLSATARFRGEKMEVWAASQAPELTRRRAAEAADVGVGQVTIYPLPVGGSGGRALEADAVPLAVALARQTGRPVQLSLPAAASRTHDRPSAPLLAQLAALPGPSGQPIAWRSRVATGDALGLALSRLTSAEPPASVGPSGRSGSVPTYAIKNVTIEGISVPMPFAAGYVRGWPEAAFSFANESFVDELARLSGSEPLAFRMGMLGSDPRLARCLSTAAALGGWDGGAAGSSMGLAAATLFGSRIGLLVEASVGPDQRIAVHRLVAAVDCGRIANAGLVRQQVESGLIWAIGQATLPPLRLEAGFTIASGAGSAGLPRLAGTPQIRVELIASSAAPGGISGLAPAVLAPAIANAIAAGTGRRLRTLPFDMMAG